jgi:hypothetical protein
LERRSAGSGATASGFEQEGNAGLIDRDKDCPTQVGRALDRLGVEHIPACSPEARGRGPRRAWTPQSASVAATSPVSACAPVGQDALTTGRGLY